MDQTHLVQDLIQKEKPKGKDGYKEIENKVIAEIVQRLQDMAHQKIQANYKVSSQQVTQAMVDEAQKVIDKLMQREEVEDFNNTLLELFSVIPRKWEMSMIIFPEAKKISHAFSKMNRIYLM